MSAIILLIVLIVTVGIVYLMLYYSSINVSFPPKISKCPDRGCGDIGNNKYQVGDDICGETYTNKRNGEYGNWDGITNANCD